MLHETYRPTCWNEVVGQDKAVGALRAIEARGGFGGRAFWFAGQSGTGKTTVAKIVAGTVADSMFTHEKDAGEITPALLRELWAGFQLSAWGPGGHALIVNEAHGLRKDSIRAFLVLLEQIPRHVVVIFTTTKEGQASLFEDQIDATPLLSRCLPVTFTARGLCEAFAERARTIAQAENLDGKPIEAYVRLVKENRNNMRAVLGAIEAGAMVS